MDIGGWLRSLGLGQYETAFRDNGIEADARARDGRKVMTEYEAQARTIREKTARLKARRLAK
jgi:hypothetical protein